VCSGLTLTTPTPPYVTHSGSESFSTIVAFAYQLMIDYFAYPTTFTKKQIQSTISINLYEKTIINPFPAPLRYRLGIRENR
jgi:hypothetical protein